MRKLFIILIGITACCSAFYCAGTVSCAEDAGMVLVPGGKCSMGAEDGDPDEMPVHEVYVDSFYIGVHEVTIGQYKKFMEATGHQKPLYWQPELDRNEDPVVGISWQDAAAYASWAGTRLPTEAEWGYAARGGSMHGKYPWGDKPDTSYANFKSFGILPVKSLKPNGYGLYDMIGNVWEWVNGEINEGYYNGQKLPESGYIISVDSKGMVAETNDTNADLNFNKDFFWIKNGIRGIARGGYWDNKSEGGIYSLYLVSPPSFADTGVGFRCVKDILK